MSSYIESPFTIEQRRLQGIVNSCRNDLNKAMDSLQEQRDVMCKIGLDISIRENAKAFRAVSTINSAKQACTVQNLLSKKKNPTAYYH